MRPAPPSRRFYAPDETVGQWTGPVLEALLDESTDDLYEHAPCGYLSLLPDGVIGRVNTTFAEWTGFSKDELVGRRRFPELLTVGGRIYYETHFEPLLRMQGQAREIAFDLALRNDARLPVLVNARQRDYPNVGAVTRITVFDATDRRRYERELLAARQRAEQEARAKADLVATLSHDVRSPLSAITTAIALLEKSSPTAQQAKYIRVLQSSTSHALTLVNNLLDLGRLEAGRAPVQEDTFSLRDLVEEVAARARAAALQRTGLDVTTHVDETLPDALIGDRAQIGQVLTNLMMNAVKFTELGLVALVLHERHVTTDRATLDVSVIDTGIGIPPDRLPGIFEEYSQASEEIGKKYGGTGLGLAISRRILRLYGSDLNVTSTPGQGTTFAFALTLKRPTAT
jgi:PAS domain S-box-containing protein